MHQRITLCNRHCVMGLELSCGAIARIPPRCGLLLFRKSAPTWTSQQTTVRRHDLVFEATDHLLLLVVGAVRGERGQAGKFARQTYHFVLWILAALVLHPRPRSYQSCHRHPNPPCTSHSDSLQRRPPCTISLCFSSFLPLDRQRYTVSACK